MYSKVYFPIKITDKYTYSSASHNHAGCPGHGVRFGKHLVSLEEFSKSPLTISSSIPVPRFSFKTTFFSSTPLLGVNWIEQVVLISTRPGFAIWSYCFKIKWLVMGSALPSVKLRLQDSIFSPLKFSHLVPCTFPPFYRDVHSPPSPCARTAITTTHCFGDCHTKDSWVHHHHLDPSSLAAARSYDTTTYLPHISLKLWHKISIH